MKQGQVDLDKERPPVEPSDEFEMRLQQDRLTNEQILHLVRKDVNIRNFQWGAIIG